VFTDTFSLPSGTGVVEGQQDPSPIGLEGDTLKEVRAFLHFSYAGYACFCSLPSDYIPLLTMLIAHFK
jgi:hypothetical protein